MTILVDLTILRQSRRDPGIGNSIIPNPGIENSSPGLQSLHLWNKELLTYLILFEHLLIHAGQTVWDCCDRWISRWNNASARPCFINNTFSSTSKLLLTPNMYCWSCKTLVKLSPYTGRISEWMVFVQRLFAQRKWITERCSLRDAFSGSVAIFIVDKWRHSDVIVIKLTAVIHN